MSASDLTCGHGHRRQTVRDATLYGFDYVEVSADQRRLDVFFLGRAPAGIHKANLRIQGGRKIREIAVTGLTITRQRDPSLDDYMEVDLDKYGDFSTYTLSLVALDDQGRPTDDLLDGFDPRYAAVDFSFKIDCPNDQDCQPTLICPPLPREEPDISYLAKDYGSFRQLLLDRLALTIPDFQEAHIPDVGITLVELLAYAGDQLSYYQDAVATEAYLATARHRISVRRHARLVDYTLHEGCNARAFVTIDTDLDASLDPDQISFCTAFPGMPLTRVLQPADMLKAPPGSYVRFEPLLAPFQTSIQLRAAHSQISFYTWGDCACCLPSGATSATLTDRWLPPPALSDPTGQKPAPEGHDPVAEQAPPSVEPPGAKRALDLKVGDILIFEEVVGPKTGSPADADPTHRQAVRLTKVTRGVDPLFHPYDPDHGQPVVEIEWSSEDALTFPLCISAQMPAPDCACRPDISVARGNVVLVHHATPHDEPAGAVDTLRTEEGCSTDCAPGETVITPAPFRTKLKEAPLTFSAPLEASASASRVILQDPRLALPRVRLEGTVETPHGPVTRDWTPRRDLLGSGPGDAHFVVEIDDAGVARLRFGNGREGRRPDAGTAFQARYSLGNGPAGNVGAETILYIAFKDLTEGVGALSPRNPLAASGGAAAEPIAEAKMFAPHAFRAVLERAITADDYAALAQDNARRLTERASVFAAAAPRPSPLPDLPGPLADDPRAALEEEVDTTSPLSAEGFVPFRRLQGARGTLRWTGSWYEADVAVDPLGAESADAMLLAEVKAYLEPYRRIGHDLSVGQALYAPLDLALLVCVTPRTLRGHVTTALLDIFSDRRLPDGRLGFFHPDNLGFGAGIFASRIISAAQAVPGVTEVRLTRLARLDPASPPAGKGGPGVPATGVLTLAPFEIARLNNDRSLPENGRLTLDIRGGR